MACSPFFSPCLGSLWSTKPTKHLPCHLSTPFQYSNKREFPLAAVASVPYIPANVDYLETQFSGHGVTFEGIGDSYVVKMGLENGSLASLMLPSGLITSYKAPMWHGGTLEVLHTTVTEEDSGAVIQGGVSLALECESDGGISWSPSSWILQDVRGNAEELIQVEMVSSDSENMAEAKYIVTLQQDIISSEIVISNLKSLPLQLTGSVISHLTVSNLDATYAIGLEGSNFFSRTPFLSNFGLIPPDFGQKNEVGSSQLWGQPGIRRFLSGSNAKNQNNADQVERIKKEEMEGEEEDNYKQLSSEMSRIYTSAPRNFTVIDRGRRNSVVVGRDGFKELYMFSPGSTHECYSKYTYICVGQSAVLKPIILGPEDVWRGGQHLHNPNL